MSYAVDIHAPAKKSLCRLPENIQTRIARSMLGLAENPRPSGVVKLSGREAWQIRIGDYRVIYTIDDAKKEVVIYAIGHRREIYR
ncbi:MAG TPA: type II toxin-antitoxin system RelE/ParE family toxin [Verrucomicrobiae bacterium]